MLRDEQIEHATTAYQAKLLRQGYNPVASDNRTDGFYEGAEWADANPNPNWHKYPDEKPSKTDEYIVAFDNGNVYTAHYTQHRDKWHDRDIANNCNTSKVIAWIEFPQPPKFD